VRDEERSLAIVSVVPGATIEGEGPPPDAMIAVATPFSVAGQDLVYQRFARTGSDGTFSVTVAQPGTYEIAGTEATVTVTEADVYEGETVSADTG